MSNCLNSEIWTNIILHYDLKNKIGKGIYHNHPKIISNLILVVSQIVPAPQGDVKVLAWQGVHYNRQMVDNPLTL